MHILDINECEHQEAYSCYGICQNLPGSFHCQCPDGTYGNTSIKGGCVTIKNSFTGDMPLRASYYHITCYISLSHLIQKLNIPLDRLFTLKHECAPIIISLGLSIGLGVGGGTSILLIALGGPYIMRKVKLQKVKKMKQINFKKNHGLLLEQLISHNTDIGERMIITLRDIEKATDNFDRARVIIGGGGHGVVFKRNS